ncbi:hypothetical protein [Algoriphagus vanfongensis]|uniref:hypothetical protein n=1 Tax=Algoriphagus vanfongensis TaxID=426371 RepID=UPI0003FC0C98|nr:hypothetical protein [Algoriphagus vanfongensis]
MDNKISIVIPPADLTAIQDAVKVLQEKLGPLLIALTSEQRREKTKMGEASKPFVEKIMEYAGSNPQFLPAFASLEEMEKDKKAYGELNPIFNNLNQITSNLSDTLLELGSDLMGPSNVYYTSVKLGVKMDVPNAKPIYNDLKVRYARKSKSKPEEEEDL